MINETKLLLLLLSLGGQHGAQNGQVLDRLEDLVVSKVSQERYQEISENCLPKVSVFDYMVSSREMVVVDYDLSAVGEHEDCQEAPEQFCRAIFTKDEQLDRVNCR